MREFFSYPTVPTFANPICSPEHHPPDQDEWEEIIGPNIAWILDLYEPLPPPPVTAPPMPPVAPTFDGVDA